MTSQIEFRPGRQTMQNVKPSDYVPFEDASRKLGNSRIALYAASNLNVPAPKNLPTT